MNKRTSPKEACRIIDAMGGTAAVATHFQIKAPSVSEWRNTGIPVTRIMYLMLARPDLFKSNRKINVR